MRTAEVIVAAYLQAFGERDFDRLRGYLADRGFRSTSPILVSARPATHRGQAHMT